MTTSTPKQGVLGRFTHVLIRLRWFVLAAWVIILAVSSALAPLVFSSLSSGGFSGGNTESDIALNKLSVLGLDEAAVEVVFHSDTLTYADPAYQAAVQKTLDSVKTTVKEVTRVTLPRPGQPAEQDRLSADGHTMYAVVWLDTDLDGAQELVPDIDAALGAPPPDVEVYLTGEPAIFRDIEIASERDLQRGELITLPVVLALLLLVFGSVIAAALPLVMGILAVTVTMAIILGVAQVLDMSIFTVNIATFLGLGVAIDYSLLMVSRFREELAAHTVADAMAITMDAAGKAIVFSALTTMLGLSGMLLFDVATLRSIGIGGIVVIGMSLLVTLTLIPVLLAILGPRVNALSILPRRRSFQTDAFWRRIALTVMRRPVLFAIPTALFLAFLGTPFLRVNMGAPAAGTLPPSYESRQGWDLVQEKFGTGSTTPIIVAVEAPDGLYNPEALRQLHEFTARIAQHEHVQRVESVVSFPGAPNVTLEQYIQVYTNPRFMPEEMRQAVAAMSTATVTVVRIFTDLDENSPAAEDLVHFVRQSEPKSGRLQTWTTGYTAAVMDLRDDLYSRFPLAVGFIMASIYIALLVMFRSVILPLKAVLMNGISIFASYGALVYIFQEGHFQDILGFKATGTIDLIFPIILFCILSGLSMDYEVFLLSRMKERYDVSRDNTQAVVEGLERTGRIITSAALVVILVLVGFALGDLVIIKAMGVSMGLAIAIDVTIVRTILVPALMRMLGDWNWWAPRFLGGERRAPTLAAVSPDTE